MIAQEFLYCFVVLGSVALAGTAGTGGSGVVIPIMMGLYHFDGKNAIALSNLSIATSGLVRYLCNLNTKHPLKNGKGVVFDYNFATLAVPASIVGASIGSIFNLILPQPIVIGFFALCTLGTVAQALVKIRKMKKAGLAGSQPAVHNFLSENSGRKDSA